MRFLFACMIGVTKFGRFGRFGELDGGGGSPAAAAAAAPAAAAALAAVVASAAAAASAAALVPEGFPTAAAVTIAAAAVSVFVGGGSTFSLPVELLLFLRAGQVHLFRSFFHVVVRILLFLLYEEGYLLVQTIRFCSFDWAIGYGGGCCCCCCGTS